MIRALLLCLVLPCAAFAQDYITTKGALSDEDFYRLVACTAPPGGICKDDFVSWAPEDAADLTVAISEIKPAFPADNIPLVKTAITQAISEINDAGAALKLREVEHDENPHITIHLWDQDEDTPIRGMGLNGVNGQNLGAAYVHVWWDGNKDLSRGVIVISRNIMVEDIQSIVLEELTQAMGLLTDIDNAWYDTRSIFSENLNWVVALQPQDKMALRRHYPNK